MTSFKNATNDREQSRQNDFTSELERTLIEDQLELKLLIDTTSPINIANIKHIGGMDISFDKKRDLAYAALVVMTYPELSIVYEDCQIIKTEIPYISGLLAYREVPAYCTLIEKLNIDNPYIMPDLFLVDGCGIMHHRGIGAASHLGVMIDKPTVGVAKNILCVDGLTRADGKCSPTMMSGGDFTPLIGDSGKTLGAKLRSTDKSSKPIYVSIGHKIDLETAVDIVAHCCEYRVPEPIRAADKMSRKALDDHE
jgi:deoxyinosine 3'endonuclease (endonuclease V)